MGSSVRIHSSEMQGTVRVSAHHHVFSVLLMVVNCPIHWVSKLQIEVTMSTMKAEYIPLSTTVCDLIPPSNIGV